MVKPLTLLLLILTVFPVYTKAATLKVPINTKVGERVNISIVRNPQDPYISTISWNINGHDIKGSDESITYVVPKESEYVEVEATILYTNNKAQRLYAKIPVSSIQIVWEAETYIPFFYKSAPLPSPGSKIRASAIVNIPNKNSDNLIYSWKLNGKILPKISGQNKKNVTIQTGYFDKKILLTLSILDPKTLSVLSEKTTVINLQNPKLIAYTKDSSFKWIFSKPVFDKIFIPYPKDILVFPFFMNVSDIFDSNTVWDWYVDGVLLPKEKVSTPYVKLKFTNTSKNSANLNVKAFIKNNFFQKSDLYLQLLNEQKTKNAESPNYSGDGFGL